MLRQKPSPAFSRAPVHRGEPPVENTPPPLVPLETLPRLPHDSLGLRVAEGPFRFGRGAANAAKAAGPRAHVQIPPPRASCPAPQLLRQGVWPRAERCRGEEEAARPSAQVFVKSRLGFLGRSGWGGPGSPRRLLSTLWLARPPEAPLVSTGFVPPRERFAVLTRRRAALTRGRPPGERGAC